MPANTGRPKLPKRMHQALEKQADKKGLKGKQRDAYVYGAMKNAKKGGHGKKGR